MDRKGRTKGEERLKERFEGEREGIEKRKRCDTKKMSGKRKNIHGEEETRERGEKLREGESRDCSRREVQNVRDRETRQGNRR